jgi:hypothetical protein
MENGKETQRPESEKEERESKCTGGEDVRVVTAVRLAEMW